MIKRRLSCVLLAMTLAQTGCYDWVAVNPTDAQKLSGSFVAPVDNHTVAVRVVDVQQPDGRVVELSGNFDVRVEVKGGEVHDFSSPVLVEQEGDLLVFRGGNRGPLKVAKDDITHLEASKVSVPKMVILVTVLTAVLCAPILYFGTKL